MRLFFPNSRTDSIRNLSDIIGLSRSIHHDHPIDAEKFAGIRIFRYFTTSKYNRRIFPHPPAQLLNTIIQNGGRFVLRIYAYKTPRGMMQMFASDSLAETLSNRSLVVVTSAFVCVCGGEEGRLVIVK